MSAINRKESLEIASQCSYFHIKKLDRIVYAFYDKVMAEAKVSPHQFSLLNSIYLAQKKLTISEFAKILAMDRTTLTRNLDLLVKNGLVETAQSVEDSRKRIFYLTPKGEKTLLSEIPVWKKAQEAFIEKVSREKYQKLMEIVKQFEEFQEILSKF